MQDKRFSKIIEYLNQNKMVTLADIAALNEVSVDTARRDLDQLEREGLLKRVRGGAILNHEDVTTRNVQHRHILHAEEKKELAELLTAFVFDGQSVGLGCGSTCLEAAGFLARNFKRLTIITNDLGACSLLSRVKGFRVILPGGEVDFKEYAVMGEQCERDIRQYNLDVAILGAHAISCGRGVTDFRLDQVPVIQAMLESSGKRILLADHSKFEKTAYVNVCGLEKIDAILTDSHFSDELQEKYRKAGCIVMKPQMEKTDENEL